MKLMKLEQRVCSLINPLFFSSYLSVIDLYFLSHNINFYSEPQNNEFSKVLLHRVMQINNLKKLCA